MYRNNKGSKAYVRKIRIIRGRVKTIMAFFPSMRIIIKRKKNMLQCID